MVSWVNIKMVLCGQYSLVHVRKEGNDSKIGLCIVPKESLGCPGLHSRAIFSKTKHDLFPLQNGILILIRVLGEHLVKALILILYLPIHDR